MSFLASAFHDPNYQGPALKQPRLSVQAMKTAKHAIIIEIQPQQAAPPVVSDEIVRAYVITIVGHLHSLIGIGEERSEASSDEDDIMVAETSQTQPDLSIFNCKQAPNIELGDYVWRIVRYLDAWAGTNGVGGAGLRCALMAIEYLDRAATNGVYLTLSNVHRLFMIASLEAAKWSEDVVISNAFFAQVAGIDLHELNAMESVFCTEVVRWKLSVSRDRLTAQRARFAEPSF